MARRSRSQDRLVVVANRLPFTLRRSGQGEWELTPASGGLVRALVPVLRDRGGVWVGWPDAAPGDEEGLREAIAARSGDAGYECKPVMLSPEEKDGYYYGFSNEIVWPLFHDLATKCNFDPDYWQHYRRVNRKFADAVSASVHENDFIWVHDYHLMLLGRDLHAAGTRARIGFFLHIPFPPLDIFLRLPWRYELLHAMLDFDLLGFQTLRDRRNFSQCVRALMKHVRLEGAGPVVNMYVHRRADPHRPHTSDDERALKIGAFPISIDYRANARRAASDEVSALASHYRADFLDRRMILGVDRLDYTKGIPQKLRAFQRALQRFPEMHQRVILVQHVVPSREEIDEYHNLRVEIERLVGEINGEYTQPGWVPVHYIHRSLQPEELSAYYRAADIALITPLKDGMNLVAKEYIASNVWENGVLILSEFAGAAAELRRGVLMVNPHDVDGVSGAIFHAFGMSPDERQDRMRRLRRSVRRHDIFGWVDSYLRAAIEDSLDHYPVAGDAYAAGGPAG